MLSVSDGTNMTPYFSNSAKRSAGEKVFLEVLTETSCFVWSSSVNILSDTVSDSLLGSSVSIGLFFAEVANRMMTQAASEAYMRQAANCSASA